MSVETELVVMNAEFTPDELTELLVQLDHARARHSDKYEQYNRWYSATRDDDALAMRNRVRDARDMCTHLMHKTETLLMRKVTEHARAAEQEQDRHNDRHNDRREDHA